jgi:hypothetical protein
MTGSQHTLDYKLQLKIVEPEPAANYGLDLFATRTIGPIPVEAQTILWMNRTEPNCSQRQPTTTQTEEVHGGKQNGYIRLSKNYSQIYWYLNRGVEIYSWTQKAT